MNQASKPVAQVIAAIQALDLGPIKLKLMDPEEGQGWSREYVERMELAYKRYLTLMVKYPEQTIAPTKDVDKFWHGHILDTMKYAEDCQSVFGYFLHHFPYFGMRGEQDAANLRAASANMHALYVREFGEPLPNSSAFCTAAAPSGSGDSAFCTASAVFCTASKPVARPDQSFCTASAAFCTAAAPSPKSASAFCTASAAFCTASGREAKSEAAFCTASVAFCTAGGPVDLAVRPTVHPAL
ncbi:MAG TPA: glycine-rich domain-containing protein-like [Burkholderiales bacterium]|nr:glycine-rich domain-containing protein-like [Burkholderiales bacterium]